MSAPPPLPLVPQDQRKQLEAGSKAATSTIPEIVQDDASSTDEQCNACLAWSRRLLRAIAHERTFVPSDDTQGMHVHYCCCIGADSTACWKKNGL